MLPMPRVRVGGIFRFNTNNNINIIIVLYCIILYCFFVVLKFARFF